MNKMPRDIRKKLSNQALTIDPQFKTALKQQLFNQESSMPKKTSPLTQFTTFFKQYNAVPITLVLIVFVLVGSTTALVGSNRSRQNLQAEIEIPADLKDVIPVSDIQAQAQLDEPSLQIVSIELENEDEGLLYKVKFSDGSIRYYDAKSGELITKNQNLEVDESVPANFVAGISIDQARQIAQQQRPGKTITKIELETEDGVVVYSVRFTDDGRVDVNATNGSVVRVRNAEEETTQDDSSDDDSSSSSTSEDSDDSIDDSSDDNSREDSSDDSQEDNSGSGSSEDN